MIELIQLFENLATHVWRRIGESFRLGISQGEETLTDTILLSLAGSDTGRVRVWKTPKNIEREKGTDWEWWIGSHELGWIRYGVQAKKIDKKHRYLNLKHTNPTDGELQIDVLDRYCAANNAIPLYCFYNYCTLPNIEDYWNCCEPFNKPQLGCTISPSIVARHAITNYGTKNFASIHSDQHTVPWRCLLSCPDLDTLYDREISPMQAYNLAIQKFGQDIVLHHQLPNFLLQQDINEPIEANIEEFYSAEVNILPKRIVAIEISVNENIPLLENFEGN